MATVYAECMDDFYEICFSDLSRDIYSDKLVCSEAGAKEYCDETIPEL